MNAVAYCHPFVPPEWIAAHGLRPCWLPYRAGDEAAAVEVCRGLCPVAAARFHDCSEGLPAGAMYPWSAVVLTTTCDQIRYTAALLQQSGRLPVFLLHVPRTWQTAAVRAFYRDELSRLGRFLVACGGTAPHGNVLSQTMLRYDRARALLRAPRPEMSAGAFAQAVTVLRGDLVGWIFESVPENRTDSEVHRPASCLPLALVGGPMSPGDYELLTAIEDAGGRFVLDATESGERTLPAPVDMDRLETDAREELVRIYFDCIPDVFQRPNDRLFAWLREQIAQRCVRGILVRRHVWCDHWHGEMSRLRKEFAVPVLEWDGAGNDPRARAGAVGRMEAFLEMLR
jgi:benzoyl-CoA reductase/2-hydroxyglutaryl-CoA dehydratase subunit BcrC/BadD/HgdB